MNRTIYKTIVTQKRYFKDSEAAGNHWDAIRRAQSDGWIRLHSEDKDLDSDLVSALEYNPQEGFTVYDIQTVLAMVEGEHDGEDYHWCIALKDGRLIYVWGGCDYTGWDCQSYANHKVTHSMDELKMCVMEDTGSDRIDGVVGSLLEQISSGIPVVSWERNSFNVEGIDPTMMVTILSKLVK